jgi:hypothetical protein
LDPRAALATAGLVAGCIAASAPAAAAMTAGRTISILEQQRADNGLPAGLAQRVDWSRACARHNRYMAMNHVLTHHEQRGSPGYTSDGAWAGRNSVLARGTTWRRGNPFEEAPIHLSQLLAPALRRMGADESRGYVCATTFPGYTRPVPAGEALYTYPGIQRTGVPFRERASESPFVPGDFVGLPKGTVTGPHIFVFGPWDRAFGKIVTASLTGPAGAEDVRWVDNFTPRVGAYLPRPSGIVIPAHPLRPVTAYTAHVDLSADEALISRTWSFTTERVPGSPHLGITSLERDGMLVRLEARTLSDAKGGLELAVTQGGLRARVRGPRRVGDAGGVRTSAFAARLRGGGSWKLTLRFLGRGRWKSRTARRWVHAPA